MLTFVYVLGMQTWFSPIKSLGSILFFQEMKIFQEISTDDSMETALFECRNRKCFSNWCIVPLSFVIICEARAGGRSKFGQLTSLNLDQFDMFVANERRMLLKVTESKDIKEFCLWWDNKRNQAANAAQLKFWFHADSMSSLALCLC